MAKTAKNSVLTKEEIENLTSLQQQQNNLIYNLGQTGTFEVRGNQKFKPLQFKIHQKD